MNNKTKLLVPALLLIASMNAQAAEDEPLLGPDDAFQDLVCIGGVSFTPDFNVAESDCVGTGAGCATWSGMKFVKSDESLQCSGGAKCRWYNVWEVDVETSAADPEAFGNSWDVTGNVGCGSGSTSQGGGDSCTADSNKPACVSDPVDGKGKVDCTYGLSVGFPPNIQFSVTCKDPVNPFVIYQAVPLGEEFIWEEQIIFLDVDGNPVGGPGLL